MKRVLFLLVTLSCISCTGYSVTGGPGKTVAPHLRSEVRRPTDLVKVNSLLVAPVQLDTKVRDFKGEEFSFYEALENALSTELDVELISGREVFGELKESLGPQTSKEAVSAGLKNAGLKYNADAVLVTTLHDYVKRVGSSLGASQPAQVDFSMRMYRVSDGAEIWRASYNFKDQALSENLFRLGERLNEREQRGWLRAEEILQNGFQLASRDFASKRVSTFSGS